MPPEAMMAVGGLVICTTRRHQQACFSKHVKQTVAPQGDSCCPQPGRDQVVQLACTQPRLPHATIAHQRQCRGIGSVSPLMTVSSLIERLSADAEMTASPCHAYAFEAPLREDLPKGFFTMRTP